MEEDIIMASIRKKTPDSSKNSSREASVSSTTSSKPYHEYIKIQNLDLLWFGQVEHKCFPQSSSANTEKSNISNGSGTGITSRASNMKITLSQP